MSAIEKSGHYAIKNSIKSLYKLVKCINFECFVIYDVALNVKAAVSKSHGFADTVVSR